MYVKCTCIYLGPGQVAASDRWPLNSGGLYITGSTVTKIEKQCNSDICDDLNTLHIRYKNHHDTIY